MAGNKALNIPVNLNINTAAAKQQLQGLYTQLGQITSAAGLGRNSSLGITQDILQATKAAASLKVALKEAINPLTGNLNLLNFSDSLKASGLQLTDFKNQLNSLGTSGNQAFNSLARSIMMAEQPLTRTNKLASSLWTTLGNTMRWQATSMAIHGIVNTASQAMGYVKALDRSLNSIQIVTGQSADEMSRFAAQANKAAKELNTTTNEYAKASLIYYQQGLSNKQVEERTKATIKLANVAGQSAKTVSDQMTAIWNNFYDGGKSLEYYADVITALGASTASSSEEIAKGLQKFSSIAKTTGLSYEYATSALSTVVAATRQSADSVGTSFKTLFSRLQGLSLGETLDDGTTLNKYSKALMTVGVNIKQANGSLKTMDSILDELGEKWKSLAQDEKVALAQTVGGVRNYTGLMSLMENWDSFQTNLQTAQMAQGTLQAQAEIYAQSWDAASKHVKSAAETIYNNLLDDKIFKGLTNGFGSILDMIGNVTNSLGGFGGTVSALMLGATKVWQPQLSNFIDRNIIAPFSGVNESEKLQQETIRLLNLPSTFSAYSGVNNMQTHMNQNFVERQQIYNKMVQEGRISPFMQSTYQHLFAAQDALNDQAIAGLEQYYANNITRSGSTQSSAQAFNSLRGEMLQNLESQYKIAANTIQTDSEVGRYANEKYQEYLKNFTPSYNKLQPQEFSRWITNNRLQFNGEQLGQVYYRQHPESTIIANQIEKLFSDRANSGQINRNYMAQASRAGEQNAFYARINAAMTNADANGQLTLGGVKSLGNYLMSRQEAADLLGENSPINGEIKNFLKEYQTVSNDNTLSDEERNQKLTDLGIRYSDGINRMVSEFDESTQTPVEIEKSIRSDMMARLGVTEDQLSEEQKKLIDGLARSYRTAGEERGFEGDAAKTKAGESSLRDKGLYKDIIEQKTPNASLGTGVTMLTSSLAGLTMGINSAISSFKILSDESSTTSQKIAAMGTGMFGLTQITSSLFSKSGIFGAEGLLKSNFGSSGISGGKLLGGATAIALAIGAAIAIGQAASRRTDEANVSRYSEMLATAQQTTSDAKAKQENLKVVQENYSNLREKLSNTTQGSQEYFNTLNELNTIASGLIDTYQLQYGKDFTLGENNLINLNPGSMQLIEAQTASAYRTATTNQQVLLFGRQFNQAQLEQNEYDQKQKKLHGDLTVQSGDSYTAAWATPDMQYMKTTYTSPEASAKMRSAMSGMVNTIANDLVEQGIIQNADFTSRALLKELSPEEMSRINDQINEVAINDWVTKLGNVLNGDSSLKNIYKTLQDQGYLVQEDISDFTEGQLKSGVASAYWKYLMANGEGINGRQFYGVDFRGLKELNTIVGNDQFGLSRNYQYLSPEQIKEQLQKNYKGTEYFKEGQNGETIWLDTTGSLIYDVITAAQHEAYNNLATAIRTNIGSDFSFDDKAFQESIKDLSITQANQTVNYLTAAGAYGKQTSKFVLDSLRNNNFNQGTFNLLKQINWDGSISGLRDIEQLARNQAANSQFFSDVLNNAIQDMGGEAGIFKTLYNTSGFQDVMENLKEEFASMGEITASSVVNLSKKSEELKDILHLSSSEFAKLNINAGGIAAVLTQIQKGTIQVGQITTSLLSSLSQATATEGIRADAFTAIDNLNLGRSGADYMDYFQAAGKAWYQAKGAQLMGDEPLRNAVKMFMPTSVQGKYEEVLRNGTGKNFSALENELPSELTDFLAILAGKKGKGGGTMSDVIDFYGEMLKGATEGEGLGEYSSWYDWLFENGVDFAYNGGGDIGLRINQDTGQTLTSNQLVSKLQTAFMGMGYSKENAKNMANIFTSVVADSSGGAQLREADRAEAIATLRGYELDEDGNIVGDQNYQQFSNGKTGGTKRFISEAELTAAYNTYGTLHGQREKEFREEVLGGAEGQSGAALLFSDTDFWGKEENINSNAILERYHKNNNPENQYNNITDLLTAYGAIGENGKLDYSRFLDFVTATGGNEAGAQQWLEQNWDDTFGNILNTNFIDQFGHEYNLARRKDETYEQYNARVQNARNSAEQGWYFDTSTNQYVNDPGGYLRQQYYTQVQGAESYWQHKNEDRASGYTEAKGQVDSIYNSASDLGKTMIDSYLNGEASIDDLGRTLMGIINGENETPESKAAARQALNELGSYDLANQKLQGIGESKITEEDVLGAAGGYAHTIGERMQTGLAVNAEQKALYDLYNQYQGLNDTNDPEGKFRSQILDAMDILMSNTGEVVDIEGKLLETSEADASSDEYELKNGKLVKKGQNGEKDQEIDLPEQEQKTNSEGYSGAEGNGSGTKTLDEIIADAKKNAPEGATSTTVTDPVTGASYTIDLEQEASGYNNTRLLGFASGKKDGFIAVTGELGPELRVKSDGSMDLLGKQGREYTWVNPDDKIYTAAQTTSILGNKSLEELQGFSHGINNFIPGFAGKWGDVAGSTNFNGSGGSGGTGDAITGQEDDDDHRYDPNWLKYRDVVERYYTILQQIQDITDAVTRFSEIADRAWGKQRQEALRETIKLQEDQIDAQKRYLSEIRTYFKGDKNTLTTMMEEFVQEYNDALADNPGALLSFEGAEFDENGVITNYREFTEALVDAYNKQVESGAVNQEEQYKFQERLKDIQQYTDTLNLLEEQERMLEKLEEQLFDSKLNEVQVVLDYKLSLSQDQMTLIDYALGKVKDDAYQAAEAVALIGEKQEELVGQLGEYETAFQDMLHLNFGDQNIAASVTQQETTQIEDDLARLEEFKKHFEDSENEGSFLDKATWKHKKEDGTELDVEHNIKEYYDSIAKYYTEYYNKYSDLLPDPEDFFIWNNVKENEWDEDKLVLENEEEVLEKLKELKEQIRKNTIYADVDKFSGSIKNLEDVNKNVQELYDSLIGSYPELKDAIAEIDEEILSADGKIDVQNYGNLMKVIDTINEITNGKISASDYQEFLDNPIDFFAHMSDVFEHTDFTNLTSQQVEMFRGQISSILSTLNQLRENREKAIDTVGDSLKTYFKDINAEIDNFDHIKDLYKDWVNVLDLTGRTATKVDHQLMSSLQGNITDNYKKKLAGVQDAYKLAVATYDDVNQHYLAAQQASLADPANDRLRMEFNSWKEQLAQAEKDLEDAENNRMQSLIDLLERLQEEVAEVFKTAAAEFEDSFSPFYHTLDMLQSAYDREQQLQDLYLDAYDQAHDLSKLNRDIQQSIIDTDNLKGKQELKKLLGDINNLQKQGNKLTQYDVDNLQKQYDIELARQALEDARNAKSLVRLTRDNNGNWSYVYTSNEEDEEAARQDLEDKLNAAEKANEDRIQELSNNFLAIQNEFEQNLNKLKDEDLTPEEMEAEAQKMYDAYLQKMNYTVDQIETAMGNNQDLVDKFGKDYGDLLTGLTTDFSQTILSGITGADNLDNLADQSADGAQTLMDRLLRKYRDNYDQKQEAWGLAELDLTDAIGETTDLMDTLGDQSEQALGKVTDAVDDAADAFNKLLQEVDKLLSTDPEQLDSLIAHFENLATSITELIKQSGEYEEVIGKVKIDGAIDEWKDLDKIYKSLIDHGETILQYFDKDGNRHKIDLTAGDDKTMQQLDAWRRAVLGGWDTKSWSGGGFDREKAGILSGLDSSKKDDILKYYDELLKEIGYQGIDRLEVTDKLYEQLKEKGVKFESEDEEKKRATIFFDAIADSEGVQEILDMIKEIMEEALKAPVGDGRGFNLEQYLWDLYASSGHQYGASDAYHIGTSQERASLYNDTGGYTGRWQSADTGMYTGEWPMGSVRSNGRLAWLHQKELVLNAHDTENFLDAMEIVRQLDNLTNWMANGLNGILAPTITSTNDRTLEQNVHIEASFPNVTDRNEIEEAFGNLVNLASQYANRK